MATTLSKLLISKKGYKYIRFGLYAQRLVKRVTLLLKAQYVLA